MIFPCPNCGYENSRAALPKSYKLKCGGCSVIVKIHWPGHSHNQTAKKVGRRNKYGNKPCRCNLNHYHRSRGERAYCGKLQLMEKAGEIKGFRFEKRFALVFNGKKLCDHDPDFLLEMPDGSLKVHEYKSKGTVTAVWKLKAAMFQIQYPDIPYIVIWH
ncbi:MAG: DUF1064 domain-containing protein [Candidatus Auribacterota bacterium]|nr:DUF1064 domain-containing protein [Candidatus Auribacterota bacterium]